MAAQRNNKYDTAHLKNIAAYQRQIADIYSEAVREAALISTSIPNVSDDKVFSFADYPITTRRINALLDNLQRNITTIITNGITAEWTLSNEKNDELVNTALGQTIRTLTADQRRQYFSNNDSALQAFSKRKVNGMNLSDRVWKYTNQFKSEIELGIDIGLREGRSAQQLSRDLRGYLQQPDKLFRRVRDEHGNLVLSRRAKAYHPGQGVYRSSYKNAIRMTGTETNMAYRTADHTRWQQLDFIVGQEIHTSNNHTLNGKEFEDMCDSLAGKYPKDFEFTGWHPNCRCYATSILKSREEMREDNRRIMNGEDPLPAKDSVNYVPSVPKGFSNWVDKNRERAKGWSSMPYFVRRNPQYVKHFEVDTYTQEERKFTRARRTSEAMRESLDIYLQSIYPKVENTEKAAIFFYTQADRPASRQLNKQLRTGNLSEFNQAFSELLSSALSKLPIYEGTVYRTIRLNRTQLNNYLEMAKNQQTTIFKGFTSTSKELSIVENMIVYNHPPKRNETDIILVIKGQTGRSIEELSQFGGRFVGKPNQREVLFDKELSVRFERHVNTNNTPIFYLSEL